MDSFDQKLVDLSKELLQNDALLNTTLPLDLIRTQIKLKAQQDNLKCQTSRLANLALECSQNSVQIRRYREFLAVLEDWLIQTQNSVSAELKFFANKIVCGDVQILEVSFKNPDYTRLVKTSSRKSRGLFLMVVVYFDPILESLHPKRWLIFPFFHVLARF